MENKSIAVINNDNESSENNGLTISEFYDKNAPVFYGQIVRIVKEKEIADRVLVKTFVDIFNDNIPVQKYISPIVNVLNHSRKKSIQTIKAIKMFQACHSQHKDIIPLKPIG
jgi:CCR4-NOT transcriptional regulation complex NOT5 subunit